MNNQVWVIWVSNEFQSDIVGVSSSKDEALKRIAPLVDVSESNQVMRHGGTVDVSIDGHSSFYLVPLMVDAPLDYFDGETYGFEDSHDDWDARFKLYESKKANGDA